MYYPFVRKALFQLDPERAHEVTFQQLRRVTGTPLEMLVRQKVPARPVTCMGLTFKNPLGLAAGLDKNGECIDALGAMGFGSIEIGTVTPRPQPGNDKPRIFRLVDAEGLINRMGFNNHGVDNLVENVKKAHFDGVLGINIGKNKDTPVEHGKDDYLICNERLHMASTWGIDLEFQTHYVLNPVPTVIEIAPNDDLQTLRNMFMSVEDKLQITAASIDAMVAKSLGEGGSRMNIDAEVRQSLKNSLLRPAAALPVDTKVRQISEQNFLTIDAPVEPSAEIVDLCYRFYTAAGTAMHIAAAVIETEIHFSLGSGESGIELSASADGTAKKYEAIQSTVEILAGITEKITQFMAPEKGGILLSAAATPILKRHRLLNEMDADTLLTYDDMALEDIDYIIL